MGLGEARFEEARHFGIMDNARSAVVSFPNKVVASRVVIETAPCLRLQSICILC